MHTIDSPLPPGEWTATESGDDEIEYGRSAECWTGTISVRVGAVRVSSGPRASGSCPMWLLRLETGEGEYATADRFGTASTREDAQSRLFDAMERLNRLLGRCEDGNIGHSQMVESVEDLTPGTRLR